MSWIDNTYCGEPSFYSFSPYYGMVLSDDVVLGRNGIYEKAKELRRIAAQAKDSGIYCKDGTREWAKRFKGYDYVVKYYECVSEYNDWKTQRATKELSPYIDAAFNELEYASL